ncbi:MAG: LEA type 2 family protein [Saprospiraceae bacterium]|nr:LEA type 2 family protein [Saprospiraceae bacterium]
MKKRSWIIIFLIIILLVIVWWCKSPMTSDSRQSAKDNLLPGIHVASVIVTEISNEWVKMDTKILLDNPLLVNINTNKIRYKLLIDSIKVLENEYNEPIIIRSGDTSVVEMPIEINAEALTSVMKYFKDNNIDSAEYSVHAIMEVEIPIAGKRDFKMNISRRLPALKLPEARLIDLDLNLFQLRKKGIDLVIKISNPNVFDIQLLEGKFNFYIEDYFSLRGIPDPDILLPAGSSTEIAINANIDGNLPKTGWEILIGKDAPFSLHFSGIFKSENNMLDRSKIKMIVNGRMDELRELMKK